MLVHGRSIHWLRIESRSRQSVARAEGEPDAQASECHGKPEPEAVLRDRAANTAEPLGMKLVVVRSTGGLVPSEKAPEIADLQRERQNGDNRTPGG
ncbi:MAG: hypothetical protein RJA70_2522 [Pseudomonadota bacterium]